MANGWPEASGNTTVIASGRGHAVTYEAVNCGSTGQTWSSVKLIKHIFGGCT